MIEFVDIKKGKLFNIILFGYIGFSIPIGIIFGLLTLFGLIPININGMEFYGITGFLFQLFFMPFLALIFTIPTWIIISAGLIILRTGKNLISEDAPKIS